jgi:hypothetical protein
MTRQKEEDRPAVSLTSTATASTVLTEDDKVAEWRIGELKRGGWSQEGATKIGCHASIDLHFAVDLVKSGNCPEETALAILL